MQTFLLILGDVVLVVSGQFCIKLAINKIGSFSDLGIVNFLMKAFFSPLVLFGLFLYFLSAALWVMILSKVELSFAYPMLSLGYILILFVSWAFLGETITWIRILGVVLICLGVFFIFRS